MDAEVAALARAAPAREGIEPDTLPEGRCAVRACGVDVGTARVGLTARTWRMRSVRTTRGGLRLRSASGKAIARARALRHDLTD